LENKAQKKRQFAARVSTIIFAVVIGAVFGPVAIAIAGATFAPAKSPNGYVVEAAKLVEAYQSNLEPGLLFLSIVPPEDGAECGYKADAIFPGGILALNRQTYTDYEGYFVLDKWRNESRDKAWIRAITLQIDQRLSPFEAGFLRRCIQGTLFAKLCMDRVSGFGDTTPRFDRKEKTGVPGDGNEDRVVCTFVDGVAARKGIPLATSRPTKN
jgi:hypothetical protein